MTINEIQERKRQLEARIAAMVTEFAADTGLWVFGLSTERHCACDVGGRVIATEYVVKAEVML